MTGKENRVALVTGGAKRVGAAIVKRLHAEGWRVAIHYRASANAAAALADKLNALRSDSAMSFAADLNDRTTLPLLVTKVAAHFGRLDALVNNASTFYPTALSEVTADDWSELMGSNLQAPLFLSQAALPHLLRSANETLGGSCIVNITDIHAERPMAGYVVYNIAKAGLRGLTRALALDLAPNIRVNAVAPGAIEWPDDGQIPTAERERILADVPLAREGGVDQVAEAVKYLICDATYVTGQTINVDGGRSIAI
jgi:pteridine reductase